MSFYHTVLDMQSRLRTPVYQGIVIETGLLQDRKLAKLDQVFENLKNLLFLRGYDDANWRAIRQEFALETSGIIAANVDGLVAKLEEQIVIALDAVLKDNGSDQHSGITLEQFHRLETQWGEVNTALTLFARYNANRAWKPEIKVLSRILHAEAEGQFRELKRFGASYDPGDQAKAALQTAVLNTPEKQNAWWNQWVEAALFSPGEQQSRSAPSIFATIQNSRENIAKVLNDLGCQDPARAAVVAQAVLAEIKSASLAELKKSVACLRILAQSALQEDVAAMKTLNATFVQLYSQLSTVPEKAPAKDEIIVTATSNALRPLLCIGALVDAGSCMNPMTGPRADVIPSPALDANIQVIFSTALKAQNFASASAFAQVVDWFHQKADVKVSFDGNQYIYTFVGPKGPPVRTLPVRVFYLRHQMKLGTTKAGSPGIVTERAFSQIHLASDLMAAQIKKVKQAMAAAMGGQIDVEIRVPGTRNLPGGTYSDIVHLKTGSGLQKGAFKIPKFTF